VQEINEDAVEYLRKENISRCIPVTAQNLYNQNKCSTWQM
jgi:hypothetical protein